jgi:hypothetical protein
LLSFATPLWLLGLALVPVIRWLHRGGPRLRSVPVSSLAPWRHSVAAARSAGARQPPDPAWRRRALIAALLSVALAGATSTVPVQRVTVWVDDSLSMLARDTTRTRLEAGLSRAAAALAPMRGVDVEVRTLANPWQRHAGLPPAVIAQIVRGAGTTEPSAPPAALLQSERTHWLVTDGADPTLALSGDATPYARVFQVGEATRNVGVVGLSARRSVSRRDRFDVQVRVTNGGNAIEAREVLLRTDAGVVSQWQVRLEPGASAKLSAEVGPSPVLHVALQPADVLIADDVMDLDLGTLRAVPVAADPACPDSVLAAVRAHPGLATARDAATAGLFLDCGGSTAPAGTPRIRLHFDRVPEPIQGPLAWPPEIDPAGRAALDALSLRRSGHLDAIGPQDRLLLSAGDEPLIVRRAAGGQPLIDTTIDPGSSVTAERPDAPLLLMLLVDLAMSSSTLDAVAVAQRDERAVLVVPRAGPIATEAPLTSSGSMSRDWTWWVVLAALLALGWEIVALGRQWRRLRADAEAWSA